MYTQVADIVRQRMTEEADQGVELAQILLPEIDRKLVKQTVMTSVYGITYIGARDQIANRLKDRNWTSSNPRYDTFLAANHIAKVRQ